MGSAWVKQLKLVVRYVLVFLLAVGLNNSVRFRRGQGFESLGFLIQFAIITGALLITLAYYNSKSERFHNIGLKFAFGGMLIFLPLAIGGFIGGETLLGHFSFPVDSFAGLVLSLIMSYMNIIGFVLLIDGVLGFLGFLMWKGLYKTSKGKLIGGVFAGLGDSLGVNPIILRTLYIMVIVFSSTYPDIWLGYLILFLSLYALAWIFLPNRDN